MVILSLAILNYLHVLQEPQAVATELPLNRGFAWLQTLGPGMNIGKNPQQQHSVFRDEKFLFQSTLALVGTEEKPEDTAGMQESAVAVRAGCSS